MEVLDDNFVLDKIKYLDDVLDYLKNGIKTEIKSSPIHGVGVFAIKDIKEGEDVFPIWRGESGLYVIPNQRLLELSIEMQKLLNMYFINNDCGFKILRLFNGLNFVQHSLVFCNSSYPNEEGKNINNYGIAIKDIKKGEEVLEYYTENIEI